MIYKPKRIAYLSDLNFIGSGYLQLSIPLLSRLANAGHEIKVVGFGYTGQEHTFPFSIIPAKDTGDAHAELHNLHMLWRPDVLIVAMDLPQQAFYFDKLSNVRKKYIAITPLENGPLCISWAAPLINMDVVFFISELGKVEAQKAGVAKAEHLWIGIDTKAWRLPTSDEKRNIRSAMGISEDTFVILTVADNQERKNLWAAMRAVAKLKKELKRPIKYIMVTREHSAFGYKLRDLALTEGINSELSIIERGIPMAELWSLYALADVLLLTSKAEGLGLPVMEAMSCGTPVVATNTGAIHELLDNDRGFLVPPEYEFIDVWGNSKRDMIDIDEAVLALKHVASADVSGRIEKARKYMESRNWDYPTKQLLDKIEEICDDTE